MAAVAAAELEFDAPAGDIELIVRHHNFFGLDFVKLRQRRHRLAGAIHKRVGLQQPHIALRPRHACHFAEKFLFFFKGGLPLPGQFVCEPKARIVAGVFIFTARIAQADD